MTLSRKRTSAAVFRIEFERTGFSWIGEIKRWACDKMP